MDCDDYCSDYYNSDDGNEFDETYSNENDEVTSDLDETTDHNEKNYTVLKVDDIGQRQMENIDAVSSLLCIPKEIARILLLNYRWNPSTVEEAWFSDEDKVRKSVGLFVDESGMKPSYDTATRIKCSICYEKKRSEKFRSTTCGHLFCVTCWKKYVETSIGDGPGCLSVRCPEPKCSTIVTQDMIDQLVSGSNKEKYDKFLVRSYVEGGDGKIKWCPAPGCEYAVEFKGVGTGDYDVMCGCLNGFCWNCLEDSHRPMDCETVAKWMTKGKAEAENTTWILAYTKPCPKCKRSIEKNDGCMHMTCNNHCKFEFCWLCLEPWDGHKSFYSCNRYEQAKKDETFKETEETKKMAENSIVKYTHYYERWANNDKSRKKALKDLHETNLYHLTKLSSNLKKPETEFEFITEAWVQIVECRRVLKWTYAYGYYFPEDEEAKKQFFEYLQGEAEAALERLHYCSETELGYYLDTDKKDTDKKKKDTDQKKKDTDKKAIDKKDPAALSAEFDKFSVKLKDLTRVTGTYFQNLVKAFEDGLLEVGSP